MSTFFPHVNINALKKFAAATAVAEHPSRATNRRAPIKLNPVVANVEDLKWAGEKVRLHLLQLTIRTSPW
jgi:hypothetical protein